MPEKVVDVFAFAGIILTVCIMAIAAIIAVPSAAIIWLGAKALDSLSPEA